LAEMPRRFIRELQPAPARVKVRRDAERKVTMSLKDGAQASAKAHEIVERETLDTSHAGEKSVYCRLEL
jgi:hypothetical protein